MLAMGRDIGIDLGTANVLIFVRGKGIVLREPSVVAINQATKKVLAIGGEARRMLGRTPGSIVAIRPLREGVIADYYLTEAMLKHFIRRVAGRTPLFRPRVMVCVPAGGTPVEKRAVLEAAVQAGARRCFLIEEPLAAALGAGIDISRAGGNLVVDIGGGTTDVAVLSLGGIVISRSLKVGGDTFDEAIVNFVKKEHNLAIGDSTAEGVKIQVGSACPDLRQDQTNIRGRDLVSGLPRSMVLTAKDCYRAMEEPLTAVLAAIKGTLEATPPELAADIIDKGIIITGGGGLLRDLALRVARETGVPASIAEDPLSCVARGTGKALESLDALGQQLMASS